MSMLKSYLLIGARQLLAQKLYSVINIVGLAVGLACAIIIFLFVNHELSFDERFEDADRIYRISAVYHEDNGRAAPYPATNVQSAAPQLKLDFADEIEESARIWGQRVRLRHGADMFYENNFRWADPAFFDIFKLDWMAGDPGALWQSPRPSCLPKARRGNTSATRVRSAKRCCSRTSGRSRSPASSATYRAIRILARLPSHRSILADMSWL